MDYDVPSDIHWCMCVHRNEGTYLHGHTLIIHVLRRVVFQNSYHYKHTRVCILDPVFNLIKTNFVCTELSRFRDCVQALRTIYIINNLETFYWSIKYFYRILSQYIHWNQSPVRCAHFNCRLLFSKKIDSHVSKLSEYRECCFCSPSIYSHLQFKRHADATYNGILQNTKLLWSWANYGREQRVSL